MLKCFSSAQPSDTSYPMKLNRKAFAMVAAFLWGVTALLVGWLHLIYPAYGTAFLELLSSIYPGYHAGTGFESVLTATGYALCDGWISGWCFAWCYNRCVQS